MRLLVAMQRPKHRYQWREITQGVERRESARFLQYAFNGISRSCNRCPGNAWRRSNFRVGLGPPFGLCRSAAAASNRFVNSTGHGVHSLGHRPSRVGRLARRDRTKLQNPRLFPNRSRVTAYFIIRCREGGRQIDYNASKSCAIGVCGGMLVRLARVATLAAGRKQSRQTKRRKDWQRIG